MKVGIDWDRYGTGQEEEKGDFDGSSKLEI